MKLKFDYLFSLVLVILILSCSKNKDTVTPTVTSMFTVPDIPKTGSALPYTVLTTIDGNIEIRNGGYGSAAVAHPTNAGEFYAMTDRGPNGKISGGKIFPAPNYTPRIGHFRLNSNGTVKKLKDILIKNPLETNITGLPNPDGLGATGEIAYDINNMVIGTDNYGLDSEGLVALPNGEFWLSDEYGPHIVHLNANGQQIERISPVGINTGVRKLPAVFIRRRANRGMEGLAITQDHSTLVGIMQSTMYNPSKNDAINLTVTRIVTFNIASGATKQYLYKQEKDNNSNSEIIGLSNTEFLVIERDGNFYGNGGEVQKHVYKIDISNATDVSGNDFNNPDGFMINGKTIEQSTWDEITAVGITPVSKTLAVDLVSALGNYPHDKLEGLWVINENTLGVLNDDDFAVESENGQIKQKILPASSNIDGSRLYIVKY